MPRPFPNFLGAAPAYPFRVAKSGLPDLEFAEGEAAVRSVVSFMLRTAPGQLPFDPALGMDPETLRFDPTDRAAEEDAKALIRASLVEAEPRLVNVVSSVRAIPSENELDINVSFGVIDRQVAGNLVVIPQNDHQDVLRVNDTSRKPIVGHSDDRLLGISTG